MFQIKRVKCDNFASFDIMQKVTYLIIHYKAPFTFKTDLAKYTIANPMNEVSAAEIL